MSSRIVLIKKILAFLIIVGAVDFGLGRLLRNLYFRQSSGFLFRQTWALEKTTAPLLILGDSRAVHDYMPQPFEEAFGMEFYNAGYAGIGVEYHEAVLRAALKRYRPERIILDLSPLEFEQILDLKSRLAVLLPYVEGHPEIWPIVKRRGAFEKIKLLSQIYPFNSNVLSILMGNLDFNKKRREDFKGFVPLDRVWAEPLRRMETMPGRKIQASTIEAFRSFLSLAKVNGVRTTVVVAPVYQKWERPTRTIEIARGICRDLGVSFLDFSQDEAFLANQGLFADEVHLNPKGALIFSAQVSDRLERPLLAGESRPRP